MSDEVIDDPVTIQEWYCPGGGMMYNCYALDADHPMHPYNQILNQGKRPEDYGFKHPRTGDFEDKSRDELIDEILRLRDEVTAWCKGDYTK